jgi:IclR family acetate operon transcriptional repressor
LSSLQQNGLVERQSDGRVRIGLGLVDLVSAYLDDLDVVEQARPVLEQLAGETLETVHLGIPNQSEVAYEVVYVDKVESPQSLRMVSHIGTRSPLYCTALGKAILAHAGEGYLSSVLAAGLQARTKQTLTNGDALRADLVEVRSRGYAVDHEEYRRGICCVAAEIRERRGRVVAALSVSGPSVRMDEAARSRIGVAVRRAADEISRRLGYQPVKITP